MFFKKLMILSLGLILSSDKVYTTDYLNLRTEPSLNSEICKVLTPNTELERIDEGEEWDKVLINETEYYVSNKYITDLKPKEEDIVKIYYVNNENDNPEKGEYLGNFKLTAYCSCSSCCGKNGGKLTSSGTIPTVNRTVACNSISAGTKIFIEDQLYIVEDTGNMASNVIDIYMESHESALNFGVKNADVYLAK